MRADARKLLRRSTVALCVTWIFSASALMAFYMANAQAQFGIARDNYDFIARPGSRAELCEFLDAPRGAACEEARRQELRAAKDFLDETAELYPLGGAVQDPVSVGGVVAGLMASLVGVVILGGLVAAHVAGEWQHGTVKLWLTRDPNRARFLVTKFLTAWGTGVFLLLIGWITMALLSPLMKSVYDVPRSPSHFLGWGYAGAQALRAVVVVGFVAALAVTVAVIVRSPLGSFAGSLGVLFASAVAAASQSTFRFSPIVWIASWMGFQPATSWGDHLWFDSFPLINPNPSLQPSSGAGLLGLLLCGLMLFAIAIGRMNRSDVGG